MKKFRFDKKSVDDLDRKISEAQARRQRRLEEKQNEQSEYNVRSIIDKKSFESWFDTYVLTHKDNSIFFLDKDLLWNKYKTTILENPYIKWKPLITVDGRSPQAEFLLCDRREVFYGGAGGGGKTVALLTAALQHVDQPGYDALLLRRTMPDLRLPGSLLDLAHKWLDGAKAMFEARDRWFVFPSGARLVFGYCENVGDEQRYRSAQFQYIGVDELTQWFERQYRFLFSRLRRLVGSNVPCRIRSASNPGYLGHNWVKDRFIKTKNCADRVFIPARLCDNPMLDQEGYTKSLMQLDPVRRAQILHGDWEVTDEGMLKKKWLPIVDEYPKGGRLVRSWDLASTPKDSNAKADWTVGAKLTRFKGVTYIIDVHRFRGSPGEVEMKIRSCAINDGIEVAIYMEEEGGASGKIVSDHYARDVLPGYNFKGIRSTGSKTARATPFACAAEKGNVKLVRGYWNDDFLSEAVLFPYGAHDDQIDAVSGAFNKLTEYPPLGGGGVERLGR